MLDQAVKIGGLATSPRCVAAGETEPSGSAAAEPAPLGAKWEPAGSTCDDVSDSHLLHARVCHGQATVAWT